MSFPAYPAYKESDVEWLGEVPEHWILTPLKHLALLNPRKSGYEGAIEQLCSFVPMEKLKTGAVQLDEERPIEEVIGGYTYFEDGDVLQAKVTPCFENKNIAIAKGLTNGIGFGSSEINVLRPYQGVNTEYLYYRVQENSYMDFCTSSMMGAGGLKRVPTDVINNFKVATPEIFEQTHIARFLDHETARIDVLFEEQQRLIELLKEKRRAVISHAVTKGLDPMVPMKDSGIEWLGEVPAHWVVCATRRVIRFIEQGWSPECESYPAEEDGWGVLKAGCVNRGIFDSSENKTLPSTLKPIPEYEVRAGDILMSRASGSPELVGSTALLGPVRERLMLSDKIFRVHLEEKVSSQFFVWVMNAQFMRSQIEQALSGGNGLANNLPQSSLLAFWLAIPPEQEQGAIAELINEQIGRIDELIAEGELAVELLQERRSALVSAAVTGKIDVRGWQPPTSVPTPKLVQEVV